MTLHSRVLQRHKAWSRDTAGEWIDVKFIQELLDHFDIKTTMRYLHVRKEQLVNIVSPLDDLFKKGGIEW